LRPADPPAETIDQTSRQIWLDNPEFVKQLDAKKAKKLLHAFVIQRKDLFKINDVIREFSKETGFIISHSIASVALSRINPARQKSEKDLNDRIIYRSANWDLPNSVLELCWDVDSALFAKVRTVKSKYKMSSVPPRLVQFEHRKAQILKMTI
jgi:hypothetical protein